MTVYIDDENLTEFGRKRIELFYPHLLDVNIKFLFIEKAKRSGNKLIAGRCSVVSDRDFHLNGYDFIIEIAQDIHLNSTKAVNQAVMDHELNHCGIKKDENDMPAYDDKTGRLKTYCIKHDLQEFSEIYARHGAYDVSIQNFVNAKNNKAKKEIDNDLEELKNL